MRFWLAFYLVKLLGTLQEQPSLLYSHNLCIRYLSFIEGTPIQGMIVLVPRVSPEWKFHCTNSAPLNQGQYSPCQLP